MIGIRRLVASVALLGCGASVAHAQTTYSWQYFRIGNTGIQGDYCEAVWVSPDGDPYIGGYNPSFEEGGFAKFVQAENRWINYSNVDYPVIGHPDNTGTVRVSDIAADLTGKLWLGTWRGAIGFDPAVGATSLVHYGPDNSTLTDDRVGDVDLAPDGTLWFANAGCSRLDPATGVWTHFTQGDEFLSVQPKATGGYLVWSSTRPPYQTRTYVFDSTTQKWLTITPNGSAGQVVGLPGKDCVDDAGNLWALRSTTPGGYDSMDYRRSDGTWVTPAEPYASVTFNIWAFKAYGNGTAVLVDAAGDVYQFDGTTWAGLGRWRDGAYTYSADVDAAGNVWVCGTGGAAKRDAVTGVWQRYRITNTSNYDDFNRDLTLDSATNAMYTGANAGAGIGGLARFDGQRWTGWNTDTYGLGFDWPFASDYCDAVAFRPSTGGIAVSPNWIAGLHEWNGSSFTELLPSGGAERLTEDSNGRLWALGDYYSLTYSEGGTWHSVPIVGSGLKIMPDPSRAGTVWASTDYEIRRTDGSYNFTRSISDFPGSASWFTGLAAAPNGVAWIGTWTQFTSTGSTLIRIDATTGTSQTFRHDNGWPFPGEHVRPLAVTPDGRLWLQYDSEYPSTDAGLCWYDGTTVGTFPAPPGGIPQWGGLPNSTIEDLEVRPTADGYELWMSCVSRGIAVLTVHGAPVATEEPREPVAQTTLQASFPNPFRQSAHIRFTLSAPGTPRIAIFDVRGRRVRTLGAPRFAAGTHELVWDGTDMNGAPVAPGVYSYAIDGAPEHGHRMLVRLP